VAAPVDGGSELRSDINVTPLVDVMLVLLVIFMVVTPLLREEIPVNLPEAEEAADAADLSQVTLTLAADGRVLVNGDAVSRADLVTELRALYATRTDKSIFLESDRELRYGAVVDAMDACREAGVVQIGVLTKRPVAVSGERSTPAISSPDVS
jgi:biopolymer transport protein TolR